MCSLLVDAGLDRVGYYTSSYVLPILQFRFMDLPLELRNIVARYALTADQPLRFEWLRYTPTKKIGTLDGLDQLTALTRVSKSLRRETKNLVWRLNDFSFGDDVAIGSHIDPSFRHCEIGAIEEAIRVFFHRLSTTTLSRAPIQLEFCTLNAPTEFYTEIEDLVTSCSLLKPRPEWKVIDASWVFDCSGTWFATTDPIFEKYTKTLKQYLAQFDATIPLRRWRVFPVAYPGSEEAMRHMVAADLSDAQVLFENGL